MKINQYDPDDVLIIIYIAILIIGYIAIAKTLDLREFLIFNILMLLVGWIRKLARPPVTIMHITKK